MGVEESFVQCWKMYQYVHLLVFFIPFFPLRQERAGGRAESRVKDIRNYIKTSEAKNSQVTAQKLRDLVAGDSSFHSLSVTPSPCPSLPSHPSRHCTSYLPPSLSSSPASSSPLPLSCYSRVVCAAARLFISLDGSSSSPLCTPAPRYIPSSLTRSRRLREKRVKAARIWSEPRKLNSQIYILDYRRLVAAGAEQRPLGGQEATLGAGREGRVC